jgi:metal-responsive CopG/Arc/MetJ family transcriptional regulator
MAGNVTVPEDLLAEVQRTAHAENKTTDEVVKVALERYLEERSWRQFVERNESRARAKGIGDLDVERLIAESRRENRQPGH